MSSPHIVPNPVVTLCQSPDRSRPCQFTNLCHETRQRIQHYADLRGMDCWFFQHMIDRAPTRRPAETEAPF